MPVKPWEETRVAAFPNLGGVDTTSAPAMVPRSSLAALDNAIFGTRKTWKKRGGLVPQNTTPMAGTTAVQYMTDYWKAGTTGAPAQDLFAVSGTHFFKDDGDNTWDDVSGTVSIPNDSVVTTCVVGDTLVVASSGTIPYKYDQTGNVVALSGTPPNGDLTAAHLSRCWMNEKTNPHKLNYTGVTAAGGGDPELWSVANGGGGFLVEPDDNDPVGITALWKQGDYLFASKQNAIYRIEGRTPDSFRPIRVVTGLGFIAQNQIVNVGGDSFGPSLEGYHSLGVLLSGNLDPSAYLSAPIHKTFHEDLNLSRLTRGHGVFIPELRSVVWAVAEINQSNNKMALVYNLSTRAWSMFKSFKCDAMMAKYNAANRRVELWTGGDAGIAYKHDLNTLTDYGSDPIRMYLKSGHIYPSGSFEDQFDYKYFNLLLNPKGSHSVTFSYRTDQDANASGALVKTSTTASQGASGAYVNMGANFNMGTDLMGEESFVQPLSLEMRGEGRAVEWELVNNAVGEDLEISGWYMELDPEAKVRHGSS